MVPNNKVEMDAIYRMESHTKTYHVKIERYSLTKCLNNEKYIELGSFDVGGFNWTVLFYPRGSDGLNSGFISLYLKLLSKTTTAIGIQLEFSLLDPNGCSSPEATKDTNDNIDVLGGSVGFYNFMKREVLEASEYLRDDCLTIKCKVTVIKPLFVDPMRKQVMVPLSDIHQNFGKFLENQEGTDITFEINEEIFTAHKCVLAARSPVFRAQLFGPMMESKLDSLKIEDMRADVFKLMLQFIYTDMCATEMMSYEMAQHLLVAADKYGLERLKAICAKKLCDSLDVASAASTLVLAEQYNCDQLKDICIDFVASCDMLDAIMETDGFKHLMSGRPLLLKEILDKVHSSRKI